VLGWLIFALTLAFVVACRIRLLEVPLDRDEGEYAYAGQQWLRGVPPFASLYHVKLPGIHAVYALVEWLFGETLRGIRLGLLLVNLGTLALVFALARRLFGPLAAGVAAAAFGTLSLGQGLTGFSANAEHFVLLPALLGLLVLLAARGSRREREMLFLAGLLLGLAYTIKQQGLFFVATGAVVGLSGRLAERPRRTRRLVLDGAAFALGAVLPFALLCALFLGLGLFEKFWWWTWYYPRHYVTQISLADGWANFWLSFHPERGRTGVFGPFWPLLGLAALGLLWGVAAKRRHEAVFTAALLLFSLLAVSAGLHFFPHYYLLAAPALALLAGAGAHALGSWLGRPAGLAAATAALGFAVHAERAYLFSMDPVLVSRTAFGANPFPESLEIARYLEAHTGPDDRIAVLGSEPQIYFYAKRRAATGYVYTYEMMRDHPHVHDFQAELAREVEAARPRYVVMVNLMASWQPSRLAQPDVYVFEWAERFLREHYERVGVVQIRWPAEKYGRFCWDAPGAPCRPPPQRAGSPPLWLSIHERRPDHS
jgi:MFS family permease